VPASMPKSRKCPENAKSARPPMGVDETVRIGRQRGGRRLRCPGRGPGTLQAPRRGRSRLCGAPRAPRRRRACCTASGARGFGRLAGAMVPGRPPRLIAATPGHRAWRRPRIFTMSNSPPGRSGPTSFGRTTPGEHDVAAPDQDAVLLRPRAAQVPVHDPRRGATGLAGSEDALEARASRGPAPSPQATSSPQQPPARLQSLRAHSRHIRSASWL